MPRANEPFQRKDGRWQTKIGGKVIYGRTKAEVLGKLVTSRKVSVTPLNGVPETVAEAASLFLAGHPSGFTRRVLDWFIRFAGGLALSEIYNLGDGVHAESLLTDYLRWLKKQPVTKGKYGEPHAMSRKTIKTYLAYATSLLRFCHTRWNSVMPDVPPMNERPKPVDNPRGLRADELETIFRHLAKDYRRAAATRALRFIVSTGCRPAEACELRWEWAQGSPVTSFVKPQHKTDRTGEPRVILVTDAVRATLPKQQPDGLVFSHHDGVPYKPSGLRSILKRSAEAALGRTVGTYTLRHTFAQLARPSLELDQLKMAMGHKDLRTTMKYFKQDSRDVRAALENLPVVRLTQPSPPAVAADSSASTAGPPAGPQPPDTPASGRDQESPAGQE